MSKTKKTNVAAPGSDEAMAKKLMILSASRRKAFADYMDETKSSHSMIVDGIAWEAFKAGEKFGRAQK